MPERREAVIEVPDQQDRIDRLFGVSCAGIGNPEIEQRRQNVNAHDDDQRRSGRRTGEGHMIQQEGRYMLVDERAAQNGTQHDRTDRQPLDPAVGDDQFFGRKQFRQDAVFGRRIGGSAQTDDRIGGKGMDTGENQAATAELDGIGDEHHLAFGQGIGESADESGETDIGHHEKEP